MTLTARITKSTTAPCQITIYRNGKPWHTYDIQEVVVEFPFDDIVVITSNAVNKTQENK